MSIQLNIFSGAAWKGRAARKEFWLTTLCSFAGLMAVVIIPALMLDTENPSTVMLLVMLVGTLYFCIVSMGVTLRRFRDIGLNGWCFLGYLLLGTILNACGDIFEGMVEVSTEAAVLGLVIALVQLGLFILIGCIPTKKPAEAPAAETAQLPE